MVWCAIKADGSICLRRCPPRVNAAAYRGILESAKAFIRPRCGIPLTWDEASFFCLVSCSEPGWRFQQDGAPAHRAASTAAWLHFQRVRRHNGGVWPPMSPDLNPVEHIWPWVLRRLEGAVLSCREQLWTSLQSEFAAVPVNYVKSLYDSLPRRMQAVIAAHGGPTRY